MNPWRIEVSCNTMFIRSHGVNGQKSKRLLGVWQACHSEVTLNRCCTVLQCKIRSHADVLT
jgi:hypothetical protein